MEHHPFKPGEVVSAADTVLTGHACFDELNRLHHRPPKFGRWEKTERGVRVYFRNNGGKNRVADLEITKKQWRAIAAAFKLMED